MRRNLIALAALAGLVLPGAPSAGAGPLAMPNVPVVASDNIEVLATIPDVTAISTAFDPDNPLMYVSTLNAINVYDIANPALPVLKGSLPMPHWENEAMAMGVRPDGTRFVLVGIDIYSVTPTTPTDPAYAGAGEQVIVVDVTDPMLPEIRGRVGTSSSTHTVQCVDEECNHAYTSGAYDSGRYHVINLTNLDAPKQIAQLQNTAGEGHQWDQAGNDVLWSTGSDGAAAYDVSDPLAPKLLASTNAQGRQSPYNDFIMHNSFQPNIDKLTHEIVQNEDGSESVTTGDPELDRGNVLLVTEEDYLDPTCGGGEGTFSTWHIPYLDAAQTNVDNPDKRRDRGKMTPLDNWNTELLGTGKDTIAGALCSAHYFTYHDAGFIAQAWYQQGTRILDVRDPSDIKQVGYFYTGASETWHAYWAPERDATGMATGRDSNIVYTNDVHGIDVLRVTLPATDPADTEDLKAPILKAWLNPNKLKASKPSAAFGYLCRIAGTL